MRQHITWQNQVFCLNRHEVRNLISEGIVRCVFLSGNVERMLYIESTKGVLSECLYALLGFQGPSKFTLCSLPSETFLRNRERKWDIYIVCSPDEMCNKPLNFWERGGCDCPRGHPNHNSSSWRGYMYLLNSLWLSVSFINCKIVRSEEGRRYM